MTTTTSGTPAKATRGVTRRHRLVPYYFIGAAVLYLLALAAVPVLDGIWLSFTKTQLLNPNAGQFTGFSNYAELFRKGSIFQSIGVTLIYSAAVVVGSVVLGVVAALVVNGPFRGRTAVRVAITIPWAIPTVAAALIFNWIYNPSSGILNRGLQGLGLEGQGWLSDPAWGLFSVTLASIWMAFPFVMLVVLASLQSISGELYEAARVDGAASYLTVTDIVLPILRPAISVVALLMTIWSFRRFDLIWLLTQGGPLDATNVLVVNIYRESFLFYNLGSAAAIGIIGLILSSIVTVAFFYFERRSERAGES